MQKWGIFLEQQQKKNRDSCTTWRLNFEWDIPFFSVTQWFVHLTKIVVLIRHICHIHFLSSDLLWCPWCETIQLCWLLLQLQIRPIKWNSEEIRIIVGKDITSNKNKGVSEVQLPIACYSYCSQLCQQVTVSCSSEEEFCLFGYWWKLGSI